MLHDSRRGLRLRFLPLALSLALIGTAQAASAVDTVTIAATIPYANDGVGSEAMRKECQWNTNVPALIVSRSKGSVVSTTQDLAATAGKTLTITTVNVHAVGGGGFSGPKWIVLRGELRENGALLGNFELRRTSGRGKSTACKTLDYIGNTLSLDVLRWLEHPTVMTPGTPAAKEPADPSTDAPAGT